MGIDAVMIYLPKPFLKQPLAQAPLGLMYVAAALENGGYTVQLENYANYSQDAAIESLPQADMYGITATSLEIPQANRFSRRIKDKFPKANIILGGPGAYSGDEFIDRDIIDSTCVGEGEEIICTIMEDIKRGSFQSRYDPSPVRDIDSIAYPARHLLKDSQGGNIFAYDHNYVGEGSTVIISSRGCPYNCAFCSSPLLTRINTMRFRAAESIADEIQHVIDTYNIRQFRFSDDMFTANKKRVLGICDAIGGKDIVWRISCRVNPLSIDILQAMWNAGCRELSFGIESFDDRVLEGLNKQATANDNVKALEMAAKVGFKTRMLFMIRTPFQTKETIRINKEYIRSVPFTIMACTAFIPIPGCDIWYNPDKYNIEILDRDLDKYNFYMFGPGGRRPLDPIIKIKDRSLEEFTTESEEFRDWVEDFNKVNTG